ncbi:MAG: TetR/AcrR family transcriptional regulator [Solirubrobacteraceae bacterium]
MAETLSTAFPGAADGPSSRQALIESASLCFAERGYAGSRLSEITDEAGLSIRAFYRHFPAKADLFRAVFIAYGEELQEALASAPSLEDKAAAWLRISRRHRGAVRAATEVVHRGNEPAHEQRRLRDQCAAILAAELQTRLPWRRSRAAALVLCDMLDQYVLMEASGWVPEREDEVVGRAVADLVSGGLYAR